MGLQPPEQQGGGRHDRGAGHIRLLARERRRQMGTEEKTQRKKKKRPSSGVYERDEEGGARKRTRASTVLTEGETKRSTAPTEGSLYACQRECVSQEGGSNRSLELRGEKETHQMTREVGGAKCGDGNWRGVVNRPLNP